MRSVDEVLGAILPPDVEAHQVTAMVVITEHVDDDGDVCFGYQFSNALGAEGQIGTWRHVGLLTAVLDQLRYNLVDRGQDDD